MNDIPLSILFLILALLVLISGFFSGSETGMLSLNRYRLRHQAKNNHKAAKRASELLGKPDRLIGTILTGNNLVNFAAAALATIISQRLWPQNPDLAVLVNTVLFTLIVLIFAELTPKTLAALYPEKVAFPASSVLVFMQWLLFPFVWLVNTIANALLKLVGVDVKSASTDSLNSEELRTVVRESGNLIPSRHRHMLLSIFDLENVSVNDIMVPSREVIGIDLDDDIDSIVNMLHTNKHTRLPVYRGNINNVIGVVHTRNISRFINIGKFTKQHLEDVCVEPYFVPENTPLHTQLLHFQKQQRRIGLVVDEYGDVVGICTLEDILEEIVGDFSPGTISAQYEDIKPLSDGSYEIDGTTYVRDINKALTWDLPIDGPKTLNGLILEALEFIPESKCCLKIGHYYIEILSINDNKIDKIKVSRKTHEHA